MRKARANRDRTLVADKLSRVTDKPVREINRLVDQLRSTYPSVCVPYVDPDCGGVNAQALLLLQAPGHKACKGGSGLLSIFNDDPTAQTMFELLDMANMSWKLVIPWNAVPWQTHGSNKRLDRDRAR